MDRRTFLRISGAVPVAGLAAWPPADDWARLRKRLAGPLFRPGDPGFPEAKQGFFTLYDDRTPAAVVGAARVEDVQAAVAFAARHGLPVAARSGGHSYPGYSTVDGGIVVDLSRFSGIDVRPDGRAVIGAGARLEPVAATLAAAGRVLPAGSCGTVGIAGLALGGGVGVLDREHGLTCDHLEAARIVTADARVRTVSAVAEPDLFWALRGGGGGNFGIVTAFTFRTVPVADVATFKLAFPVGTQAALLAAWLEWQPSMPDELWSGMGLGAGHATLDGTFLGPEARMNELVDDLVRRVGTPPAERGARVLDHLGAMRAFDDRDSRPGPAADRAAYVGTSRMLMRPLADPGAVAGVLTRDPRLGTIIDAGGGAIARVGVRETAFPHRTALAGFQFLHGAEAADGGEAEARRSVAAARDGLGPEFGTTGYVNYLDPEMPDWAQAYYGVNLPKLRAVARKYDPRGVFAFPQGLSAPRSTVHIGDT
ncbi:FAD-binding oxidoreductase [Amycolatopsis australiensis]|uniref:FAD/FMN-containing dehydrogenase n=1 Tax=Amycolatopsis australiensis TaxID=546364 RepID=A0A1K1S7B1_9PSEU|nr:FAD-binding oxidoreductase [Amycolatopsis australiensis]SFW80249.1 FAD/FMN-containing dehydrogenase [Amycolatopsis australiensis]